MPAVGPRLSKLLFVALGLFALLVVDSVYLLGMRSLEAATGRTYQNWFYLILFLLHLVLGVLLLLPAIGFGVAHWWRARTRPNRRAVAVGYALFASVLLLLASGIVLTRLEGIIVVHDPTVRAIAWWVHVLVPVAVAWLFVLHRLAGKRIRWAVGRRWALVAALFAGALLVVQSQDPRRWNMTGPASGERYFLPSLARTATGGFIPARALDNNAYCAECHADTHERWQKSAHRFSSFNNPPYLFSVRETRKVALERDGDLQAARFCAGCHDPVVFFSGRFDDPEFDDVRDPTAQAGITCTVCHAITHVNCRAATRTSPSKSRSTTRSPTATTDPRLGQPPADQGEARVPQEDLSQTLAPHAGVLRRLPQGASAAATQRLQVAARPESLRLFPALGRLRPRRRGLLLSGESREQL